MKKDFNMVEAFNKHIDSLTEEELDELRERFKGPEIPIGWVSIEDHLPMMCASDLMKGYTEYRVKYENGNEGTTGVSDHNMWYYEAKESGVTHWYNR